MLRAGTKGPTRTNQRTFDQVAINIQGSKYASDATPSMRTRLYFGLPSNCRRVDEQRRRCRWLKFMSDGTTPIPTARMAIPSLPAGRFWRSRDTPRRILLAKLLVSSRWPNTLAFIQVSRDWIRFCPLRFSFSPVPCPFCLTHRATLLAQVLAQFVVYLPWKEERETICSDFARQLKVVTQGGCKRG